MRMRTVAASSGSREIRWSGRLEMAWDAITSSRLVNGGSRRKIGSQAPTRLARACRKGGIASGSRGASQSIARSSR